MAGSAFSTLVGIVIAALPAHRDNVRPAAEPLVVDVQWLAAHQRDANLILLHVGDKAEYDKEHIPGARYIQMQDVSTPRAEGALSLEFPAVTTLREKLAALGISDESRIVVYYGNDWVSPATRIVHTLNYVGLGDRVSLLNGGMAAWKKAGNTVTDVAPTVKQGNLSAKPTVDVTVTADWVKANMGKPGVRIIDARARNFYDGTMAGGDRPGHIQSAVSVPFTELTDDLLNVKSREQLEALFKSAGVGPNDTLVVYCHIGQQGTAIVFAGRLLGRNIRLYDGSYQDWDKRADYPVENPAAKKGL